MDIETLKNAWVNAGEKVSQAQDALEKAIMDDNVTAEQIKDYKAKVDAAKAKRDAAKTLYDEKAAEAKVNASRKAVVEPAKLDAKAKFISNFKNMLVGKPMIKDAMTSQLDENGNGIGLTIPEDLQTQINLLKRQYNALEQYVNVIPVVTQSGRRVLEATGSVSPLQNLDDETDAINDLADPQLVPVNYHVQRYAGISTLTNSLLKDTDQNILAYLTTWIARKSLATRNFKIIDALETLPAAQKKALEKFDDVVNTFEVNLDPAIQPTAQFFTNQSGFAVLNAVKDSTGRSLLTPNPANPATKMIEGKNVIVISDAFLPNIKEGSGSSATTVYPLYIGDLTQAVALFDREQTSLATTADGAGAFEHDETKVRVIDRFDVQLWDQAAVVYTTFGALS